MNSLESDALTPRPQYMEHLAAFAGKHVIKVITGVCRCGKSTLLRLYRAWLKDECHVPDERMVVIDLDLLENEALREKHALHQYVLDRLVPGQTTYVFIDEVQRCSGFEDAVESLYARPGTDLYVTGSNAELMSPELGTLLSGRYVEIPVYTYSFHEYAQARHAPEGYEAALFPEYMRWGGFPELATLDSPSAKNAYLEGIYNTVLVKDIAERHTVRDMPTLIRIAEYLYGNIGSLISTAKISGALISGGIKTSRATVNNYIAHLTDAQLFYTAVRHDLRGKERLTMPTKHYASDVGLRNHVAGDNALDSGHVLENIVYLELRRRGYNVYVGMTQGGEVDFIARKMQDIAYIQVSETVTDPRTRERELSSFRGTPVGTPCYLITNDTLPPTGMGGVRHVNVVEWLLGRDTTLA